MSLVTHEPVHNPGMSGSLASGQLGKWLSHKYINLYTSSTTLHVTVKVCSSSLMPRCKVALMTSLTKVHGISVR